MTRFFTRTAAIGLALSAAVAATAADAQGPGFYAGPSGYDCGPPGFGGQFGGGPVGYYGASYGDGWPSGAFGGPAYFGGPVYGAAPEAMPQPTRQRGGAATSAAQTDPDFYYRKWYETR